jgi:hypothetical protein
MNEIEGYRELTQDEIDTINSIKLMANRIGEDVEAMSRRSNVDQRWLAIAKTDLQKGFMSLVRSVAKPTTF